MQVYLSAMINSIHKSKNKNDILSISKLVIGETVTVLKNKLPTNDIREIYNNPPHLFEIIDD